MMFFYFSDSLDSASKSADLKMWMYSSRGITCWNNISGGLRKDEGASAAVAAAAAAAEDELVPATDVCAVAAT